MSTTTIDTLVRILDEERTLHARARASEGTQAMHRHAAERSAERAKSESVAALRKIEELEKWIDAIYQSVPEKDRKKWPKRPAKYDDIPF